VLARAAAYADGDAALAAQYERNMRTQVGGIRAARALGWGRGAGEGAKRLPEHVSRAAAPSLAWLHPPLPPFSLPSSSPSGAPAPTAETVRCRTMQTRSGRAWWVPSSTPRGGGGGGARWVCRGQGTLSRRLASPHQSRPPLPPHPHPPTRTQVSTFYLPRWRLWLSRLAADLAGDRPYNAPAWRRQCLAFTAAWVADPTPLPTTPAGDPLATSARLCEAWAHQLACSWALPLQAPPGGACVGGVAAPAPGGQPAAEAAAAAAAEGYEWVDAADLAAGDARFPPGLGDAAAAPGAGAGAEAAAPPELLCPEAAAPAYRAGEVTVVA